MVRLSPEVEETVREATDRCGKRHHVLLPVPVFGLVEVQNKRVLPSQALAIVFLGGIGIIEKQDGNARAILAEQGHACHAR